MNKALAIAQRHELWALIKKVSNHFGGDDQEWLKEYARQIVDEHGLEKSLACFKSLTK